MAINIREGPLLGGRPEHIGNGHGPVALVYSFARGPIGPVQRMKEPRMTRHIPLYPTKI